MSNHYPEVHKIIMDSIEACSFRTSAKPIFREYNKNVRMVIEVPKVKNPVNIVMTQISASEAQSFLSDNPMIVYVPAKSWNLFSKNTFFDTSKLFSKEEKERINQIFKKIYDSYKAGQINELMDKHRMIDAIAAADLIKQMKEAK